MAVWSLGSAVWICCVNMRSYNQPKVNVRTMDEREFLPVCKEVLAAGGSLPLRVTGVSMRPFLKEGRDTVLLLPVSGALRRGDVVLFTRPGGKLVLHRIVRLGEKTLLVTGDNQVELETVPREAVLAVAQRVLRGEKTLTPGNAEWIFFRTVWRWLRPLRPFFWRIWRLLKGK